MPLTPFHEADPSNILSALYRELGPEQVVSLFIHCDARSAWQGQDDWLLIQQVLSHQSVYDAFKISSLPARWQLDSARGLEVIGTLANLLAFGGIHRRFVDDFEIALAESRRYLDTVFLRDYRGAMAYSMHGPWCEWFVGEDVLDETILINRGNDWWLLAVTGTD